jgi:ABC-2 type transport system permease protein
MNDSLPSPSVSQPLLFQRLRWRLFRNNLGVLLRRSPVRVITIFLCSALIWGGLFAFSLLAFTFLKVELKVPLNLQIVGTVLNLLFVVMTVLLTFSTAIILYSSLFASDEANFLLSTPAAADQVFAFKYQGAVAFSSWAFILLGSPLLIAYGLVLDGTPWYFFAVVPLFFLGFVLLPGSMGALACLLLVNFFPRRRKQALVAAGLMVLAGAGWMVYRMAVALRGATVASGDWVNQLLGEFSLFRGALTPSHWMAEGLESLAVGDADWPYYLALVWSNGLFVYLLTAWAAARLYRRGYNRVATGGTLRRRYGGTGLDRLVGWSLRWLRPQTRLLIIKDFRTFRRDPAQWAQVLIFTALAALYATNVGRFQQQEIGRTTQKNLVSLLNLSGTAFLLCAYTGRFIYPMISLEGRKFWILGLLPFKREDLIWGKFAFSALGSLLLAEFVVVFSDLMLNVPWVTLALHAATVAVLALGLSGLSVGLGAWIPNFRETDPSKLAVGFGGTLNLVAGLLYLVVVIAVMALPWHLHIAVAVSQGRYDPVPGWWLMPGVVLGLGLGFAAVVVPLRIGIAALRRMEF